MFIVTNNLTVTAEMRISGTFKFKITKLPIAKSHLCITLELILFIYICHNKIKNYYIQRLQSLYHDAVTVSKKIFFLRKLQSF